MSKISIIIPVYFNSENLISLFDNLDLELIPYLDNYEIVAVDDGSKDDSYDRLNDIASKRNDMKVIKLSRNFGSHAAILAGMINATGDCCVVKTADLQEPCQLIIDMYESWKKGNKIVLGLRDSRDDGYFNDSFSNLYYKLVQKTTLKNMPDHGFDTFLLDREAVAVLESMSEINSAITLQILWCGFKTDYVYYVRKEREIGKSRWTIRKKVKLVVDSLVSFSSFPIKMVSVLGGVFSIVSAIWIIVVIAARLSGEIMVDGWTTLLIVILFSFGLVLLSLGIIGEYVWRILESSRNRPLYIIEEITSGRKSDDEEK